jgi:hypothetical protein
MFLRQCLHEVRARRGDFAPLLTIDNQGAWSDMLSTVIIGRRPQGDCATPAVDRREALQGIWPEAGRAGEDLDDSGACPFPLRPATAS